MKRQPYSALIAALRRLRLQMLCIGSIMEVAKTKEIAKHGKRLVRESHIVDGWIDHLRKKH